MFKYKFDIYIYSRNEYQFYLKKINAFEIINELNNYFYPYYEFRYAGLSYIFENNKKISFCIPLNNAEIFSYLEARNIDSYSQIKRYQNTYNSYMPIKTKFDYWDIKQDTKIIFLKGIFNGKNENYFIQNNYKIIKLNYDLMIDNFVIMPFNFSFSDAENYFFNKRYLKIFKLILNNIEFKKGEK